jgi:hypothetical protein
MTTTPDYFYSKLDVAAINVIVRGVSISVRNRRATSPDLLAVPYVLLRHKPPSASHLD